MKTLFLPPTQLHLKTVILFGMLMSSAMTDHAVVCGAEPLPNIVILYADDMGFGDLAIQNRDSRIPTPHLDQLARDGVRFTDAHSSSGICTPSRYALLHGRYHWRKFHGIVNSFDQPIMDDARTTMPEMLKAQGYATACIGKWHLGWDWDSIRTTSPRKAGGQPTVTDFDWSKPISGGPLSHGFDSYFGDDVPNFPPYAWFENDRILTPPTVPLETVGAPDEGAWEARPGPAVKDWDFRAVMPTLTEKAVEWIGRQSKDQPFFLYFPFTSPHAPIIPADDFRGKSAAGGFGDFVMQTDWTVGQVLKALDDHGFQENTIVIFSADNGPEHYAYERLRTFQHRSTGPYRGLKRDIWEGGHRVPMIIRWPGKAQAGRVSEELISQIDLLATLAAVVNAELPEDSGEDSFNQLSLLLGNGATSRSSLVHNTNANGYAVRQGDWVLIDAKSGGISKVPPWFDQQYGYSASAHPGELYNLRDDPGQKKNLYAEFPNKVAELKSLLAQIQGR
jgi:arylsulfatase A